MSSTSPAPYTNATDFLYHELHGAAGAAGAFIDDEADEKLLDLANHLADHPESDIDVPTRIPPVLGYDATLPNDVARELAAFAVNNGLDPRAVLIEAVLRAVRPPGASLARTNTYLDPDGEDTPTIALRTAVIGLNRDVHPQRAQEDLLHKLNTWFGYRWTRQDRAFLDVWNRVEEESKRRFAGETWSIADIRESL